jgi:hypothetical protein
VTNTTFPNQLDTFVNPQGTDSVQLVSHALQHSKVNDALYAIQLKLGINNSLDTGSIENRLTTLKSFVDNITTSNVAEGLTNKYFTDARAQDAIAEAIIRGNHSHITIDYNRNTRTFTFSTNPEVVLSSGLTDTLGDYLTLSDFEALKDEPDGIPTLDTDGFIRDSEIPSGIARDSEVQTSVSAAQALAISTAGTDATTKANAAQAAAQSFATAADTALHTTVTGEIATAKSEAISTAAADATAKANAARQAAISAVTNSAPAVLDTLKELSDALGSDPNFATTIATNLAGKSNVGHTHLSSNITDFIEAAQDASALLFNHNSHNNVTATYDDENNKIVLTVSPQLTQEQVQDYIVPLFQSANNKNMNIMYDDENNQLIVEAITEPSKAVMSDTAPTSPAHGAFWLDTDEFRSGVRALKIYNKYPAAYKGNYNNGGYYGLNDIVSIPVGSPYGNPGEFYIRSGNPSNPGYPPGDTNSWTLYSYTPGWEYASTALGLATENVWTAKNTFNQGVIIGMDIAPTNPVEGQIYYNLAAEKLRVFDGLVWKDVSGGAGGGGGLPSISTDGSATPATLFFGMIAPPSAAALEGDIWFDVDDLGEPYGQFYTGLTAPDPDQYEFWVDPSLSPGELIYSADEPTTPQYTGELWIDTDDLDGQLLEVGANTPNPNNVQLWVDVNDIDTPSYYTNLVFTSYANYAAFPVASSKPGMLAVDSSTGLVYISINNIWVVQPTQTEHTKTKIQSQGTQALVWMGFL